jgi:hypothetical protein
MAFQAPQQRAEGAEGLGCAVASLLSLLLPSALSAKGWSPDTLPLIQFRNVCSFVGDDKSVKSWK